MADNVFENLFRPDKPGFNLKLPGPHPYILEAHTRDALVAALRAPPTPLPKPNRPTPVRSSTVAMPPAPPVRPTLPQSKSLLYIDHDIHSNAPSAATTPTGNTVNDPLAEAGKAVAAAQPTTTPTPPSTEQAKTTPPSEAAGTVAPSQLPEIRKGFLNQIETQLPDVHADPSEYYGGAAVYSRARTMSNAGTAGYGKRRPQTMNGEVIMRNRRLSHDETTATAPRRFLVDVEETMRIVLEQEDTDNNFQISVYDSGPKLVSLGTASSNAYRTWDIRGNYMLSNLLQELALARDYGRKHIVLDEARLAENPVDRLSRMIKNSFWNALTRRIDAEGLEVACADPKNRSRHARSLIYVPAGEDEMVEHYKQIAREKPNLNLEVIQLPPNCDDPAFVKSLNDDPGILALAMKRNVDANGKVTLEALPFIVPGARFNEKYGWDSYFMALGLLVDGHIDLAKDIVEHCIFEIKHYNKVLNGNRTYYLARSQPPFFTDLALQIFNQLDRSKMEENKAWLKRAIQAAIKEYHKYWMSEPALDPVTGLSRYRPAGLGIPPETEASHFTHILQPYAEKLGISVNEYIDGYNDGTIKEPELDEYFMHDRGVRESGHDTTYRLDKRCGDLATVDLNSLLYKYEIDIAAAIECIFDDRLDMEEEFELSPWPITPEAFAAGPPRKLSTAEAMTSKHWYERANVRKAKMDEYLWNDGQSMYFDYDTKQGKQARYESVTTLWPLWAGCASETQALKLVRNAMPKFEVAGGLVSGTEESRGLISLDRPNRQWDYPYGWPPHQIMAWVGLERYGFLDDAARLAYRWIYMMTLSFVDFNGIVPEKFDAVELSHMVDAEYGNQGVDFRYVPREGFGWMNAAYQIGLQCLTTGMRRAVAACTPPWVYFGLPAPDFPSARRRRAEREARDAAAAASGHGGAIKEAIHQEPPSLEQAIAQLKVDLTK
ncbi:alpha,alpha-trehalase nth1 [Cryptotrichosporon argae]